MNWFEWLKVIIVGIVEGLTEWLPVSSTGHMILVEKFLPLSVSPEFLTVFNVVIQFGAILAVITLYFNKLNPLSFKKTKEERQAIWLIWAKVIVAVLPAVVFGLLLDDWMDEHLYTPMVIASMLILYGVVFVILETVSAGKVFKYQEIKELSFSMALGIGLFQVLALVPGTSRSGVTIIGAMLLGCSRVVAAEFTFYLAIPVMAGASLLKLVKFVAKGGTFNGTELGILFLGMAVAYVVSILAIRFLMSYIKKNNFEGFGYYRIALGAVVLALLGPSLWGMP